MSLVLETAVPAVALPAPDAAAAPSASSSGRDTALDLLRGVCIVSMVCNHVAPGSVTNRLIHAPLFIDGAMGFFFLSGFVLGMVHVRRLAKMGERAALGKVAWRAGQIYLVHVVATMLAVLLHAAFGWFGPQPAVADLGGWGMTAVLVALLRFQPPFMDILPMYVVYLSAAIAVLYGLRRLGYGPALLALLGVYTLSSLLPGGIPWRMPVEGGDGGLDVGAWGMLFLGGLLLGHARQTRQLDALGRFAPYLAVASAAVLLGFFLLAQLQRPAFASLLPVDVPAWLFDKSRLGPLSLLYFASALMPLYLLAGVAVRWMPRVAEFFAIFGRASLYTYLAHFVFLSAAMGAGVLASAGLVQDAAGALALALLFLAAMHRPLGSVIPN